MELTPPGSLDAIQLTNHIGSPARSVSDEANASGSAQPLALHDVSLSLTNTAPYIAVSPTARLSLPVQQTKSTPRRPSTASAAEERCMRLPSSSPGDLSTSSPAPSSSIPDEDSEGVVNGEEESPDKVSIQEVNRRAMAAVAGLRAEASRLAGAGE